MTRTDAAGTPPDDRPLDDGTPELAAADDPFDLFAEWMAEAEAHEVNDPNAMALATVGADGQPSVRMVLLKGVDEAGAEPRGFVFYTNLESRKGVQLAANGKAALCFHWKSLRRQIRVEGPVLAVSEEEADAYFESRPRGSRIGAWASKQSRPLSGRAELLRRAAEVGARHAVGRIPRPPHWSGFRVVPARIEFWRDRPFRLHDRLVYHRDQNGAWTTERLYP
ncbi:MAG: pyridoxamine 5'-phosphate oxidase [Azospirillaceae bacterium]